MIGYLKGKVLKIYADYAIVVVGGVGYEVYCSGSAFSKMTEGAEVELYTYMQVSEASPTNRMHTASPSRLTTRFLVHFFL